MSHGYKAFLACDIEDCESCAKFVERYPLPEKRRGNGFSAVGPQSKGAMSRHGKHRKGWQRA